jgi:hypothetical protein
VGQPETPFAVTLFSTANRNLEKHRRKRKVKGIVFFIAHLAW